MKTLLKFSPIAIICLTFFAAGSAAAAGIRGLRSGVIVTPRVVQSFKALASAPENEPASVHMHGEDEENILSPLTEAEYEAMKEGPRVQWDGKGILTIDPSANQIQRVPSGLQAVSGPVLSTNFEGTIQDFSIPCDAMVAAGPNHVISTGNSTIRIRTKAGAIVQTVRADVFFGSRFTSDYFDPKVIYDVIRRRFVILYDELVDGVEANYFVAISQTPDATGGWYIYQFNMQLDGGNGTTNWSDFPGLGIDDSCMYMTANMFTFPVTGATFQYVKTRVTDRAAMYAGQPVGWVDILGVPGGVVTPFTLKPCLSMSHTSEEFLIINPFAGGSTLALYHITGGPSNPVLDNVAFLPVSGFSAPPDAPQKDCSGTNSKIKVGDARTHDPVWRDGYLYATHTIGVNINSTNVSAIRYYKVNTQTTSIVTDETFGADQTWYFYPAVTVDAAGSVYFSFGRSNANEYVSAYYSGKRRTDTNIEPSLLLKPGGLAYRCGSSQRWGDYDGVSIDPSDTSDTKSSAWPVGLWAKGTNTWASWIGNTAFFYHAIAGTVLDDCDSSTGTSGDRLPVKLASVVLHRDTTILATTTTDSLGRYRFGLLDDGTYDVTLTLPPSSYTLDASPGTGGDTQAKINATDIRITVSGSSSGSEVSAGNDFLIVRNHPVSSTSGLSPNTYSAGEPDFTITVNGSEFVPCSVVRFSGNPRATTYVSPTQIQATILASDIDSTGSFFITVSTPTPAGGVSNTQKFTVHTPAPVFSAAPAVLSFGSVLVGHVKEDTLTVTNIGTDTLKISAVGSDNGQFTVSPGSATIPRQMSQAFAVDYVPASTDSTSGHIIFIHNASTTPDSSVVRGGGRDSTMYRTATPAEWATAVDTKGKHKSLKRKPDRVYFTMSLTAPANPAVTPRLSLSFSMEITSLTLYTSKAKTDTLTYTGRVIDPKRKIWTYSLGGSVAPHNEIQLDGVGAKGKAVVLKYAWTDAGATTLHKGVVPDSLSRIDKNKPGLPVPNLMNVGEELFPKGFGQGSTYFSDLTPLLVGVPRGSKGASSVRLKKYTSVLKSFIDTKTNTQHTQGPTCLNRFIGGDSIGKQASDLSPLKKNDKLFAQLLALKLNIAASATHKFPVGLGELTFLDATDTGGAFNDMLVSDIAKAADTLIACLPLASIQPSPTLAELFTVLQKINAAFSDSANFKDTVSFFQKTVLTGVKAIGDVPWMHASPGIVPVTFVGQGNANLALPLAFTLYQNFPNPFNPVTTIAFDLPEQSVVTLKIYDVLGREVAKLINNEVLDDGTQEVEFDGSRFASGVYFYQLTAQGVKDEQDESTTGQKFIAVKKMLLVK